MATMTIINKFNEVKGIIPFEKFGKEQSRLGDIVDWLRDYYGGPKDFNLAYMLLGYYQSILDAVKLSKQKR